MPTKKKKSRAKIQQEKTPEQRKKEGTALIGEQERVKNKLGATGRRGSEEAAKVVSQREELRQQGAPQRSVEEAQAAAGAFKELEAGTRIEELTEQVINPDLSLRETGVHGEGEGGLGGIQFSPAGRAPEEIQEGALDAAISQTAEGVLAPLFKEVSVGKDGKSIPVPEPRVTLDEAQRETKGLITGRIDKDTSVISAEAQILFTQIVSKTAKLAGGQVIDKRLQNMEQALVNHKEGAGDIILALQAGSPHYGPAEALQDSNNMVDDVATVEETMKLLSIHAPSVYAEMKGWEFTTRITKIRRSLIKSQGQILNMAEFGTPQNPDLMTTALALDNLQQ